jgi:hypothetical protein
MKIFIGTYENCGMIHNLSCGFKELNHEVTTLVKNEHRFLYNESYSIKVIPKERMTKNRIWRKVLSELDRFRYNLRVRKKFQLLTENDLFIFIWDSILPKLEDIEKLRALNKRVVFLFIGSDVRHISAFKQEFPDNKVSLPPYLLKDDLNKKLKFIRNIELLADDIYSVPDQAGLQVLPYNHFFLPLNSDKIEFFFPNNDIPLIVHAPSNPGIKGTDLILKALESLKLEGIQFELKLLQNVSNVEVQKALKHADIAIDQIHLHGPGMFGLEAMASGCALATRYLKQYAAIFSPPAHYIDDSEALTDQLRELIKNKELRKHLAYAGRKFVETNNNPKTIASTIITNLQSADTSFDYAPEFFLKIYELNGVRLNREVKRLNETVMNRLNLDKTTISSLKRRQLI